MNAREYSEITGKSYEAFMKELQKHGGEKYGAVKVNGKTWEIPDPRNVASGADLDEPDPLVFPEVEISKRKYEYFNAKHKKAAYLKEQQQYNVTKGRLVERTALEGPWKEKAKQMSSLARKLPSKMKNIFGDTFTDRMVKTLEQQVTEMLRELAGK